MHLQTDLCFYSPGFLFDKENAPYSMAGTLYRESKCLASWENIAIPTTDSGHITLLLFTQSISSCFCDHVILIECTKLALIVHFKEFLTADGCEGDIQFHLDNYMVIINVSATMKQ